MLKKIGLVGAGNIGGSLARLLLAENLGKVVLYDKAPGLAEGKALDLKQAFAIAGQDVWVHGSDEATCLKNADILVVTAGLARQPGMTREDLLEKNVAIYRDLAKTIVEQAPESFILVVTNPLDIMVWVMRHLTDFPPARVFGMAGVLDSGRFSSFLADWLAVNVQDIHTMVLGGHGDLMVPLCRYTTVRGVPLKEWMRMHHKKESELEGLVKRTRQGGAEIVELLKRGSAYEAPAASCLEMVRALVHDEKRVLPCAAYLDGTYGFSDVYAGLPVVLGAEGCERIVELPLEAEERAALKTSVEKVQTHLETLRRSLAPL